MWSKAYVGLIVLFLLLFLYSLNSSVQYINKKYKLQENNGWLPFNCFSNTVCGMNGNILLIYFIYVLIPTEYFDAFLEAIKPQNFNKLKDDKTFESIGKKTINEITSLPNSIINTIGNTINGTSIDKEKNIINQNINEENNAPIENK